MPTQYHFLINFWFYKGFIIICPWKFRVWGAAEGMQYYLITPELYISVLICHVCRLYSLVLSLKKKQTDFCSKFWCSLAMRHKDNSLLIYDRAEIKKTYLTQQISSSLKQCDDYWVKSSILSDLDRYSNSSQRYAMWVSTMHRCYFICTDKEFIFKPIEEANPKTNKKVHST